MTADDDETHTLCSIIRIVIGHRAIAALRRERKHDCIEEAHKAVSGALSSVAIAYGDAVDAHVASGIERGEAHDLVGKRLERFLFSVLAGEHAP